MSIYVPEASTFVVPMVPLDAITVDIDLSQSEKQSIV